MSEYISIKLRNLVRKRANKICEYCHIPEDFMPQPFCFEHILPKFSGGKASAENLALACQGCNAFRATRTEFEDEVTGETVKLFNPRKVCLERTFYLERRFYGNCGNYRTRTSDGRSLEDESFRVNKSSPCALWSGRSSSD